VLSTRNVFAAALLLMACTQPAPAAKGPAAAAPTEEPRMYPALVHTIEALAPDVAQVPAERRATLDRIAEFVRAHGSKGATARLTFICTGNSRRSHLGQLWAAAAARYYGVDAVETFSGGTEPSAFNPRTIAALQRAGFTVEKRDDAADNPHYAVRWSDEVAPVDAFSKRYDDDANPHDDFVAVMTCTDADQECPLVPGAALRVSLPYDDPKVADGTAEESARYDERSRQIATEMLYVFAKVAGR
jgi:protein-tyrosine-phosphatase